MNLILTLKSKTNPMHRNNIKNFMNNRYDSVINNHNKFYLFNCYRCTKTECNNDFTDYSQASDYSEYQHSKWTYFWIMSEQRFIWKHPQIFFSLSNIE